MTLSTVNHSPTKISPPLPQQLENHLPSITFFCLNFEHEDISVPTQRCPVCLRLPLCILGCRTLRRYQRCGCWHSLHWRHLQLFCLYVWRELDHHWEHSGCSSDHTRRKLQCQRRAESGSCHHSRSKQPGDGLCQGRCCHHIGRIQPHLRFSIEQHRSRQFWSGILSWKQRP